LPDYWLSLKPADVDCVTTVEAMELFSCAIDFAGSSSDGARPGCANLMGRRSKSARVVGQDIALPAQVSIEESCPALVFGVIACCFPVVKFPRLRKRWSHRAELELKPMMNQSREVSRDRIVIIVEPKPGEISALCEFGTRSRDSGRRSDGHFLFRSEAVSQDVGEFRRLHRGARVT
jgi:hypothetical protein